MNNNDPRIAQLFNVDSDEGPMEWVEDCPACRGKGWTVRYNSLGFAQEFKCPECAGVGLMLRKEGVA